MNIKQINQDLKKQLVPICDLLITMDEELLKKLLNEKDFETVNYYNQEGIRRIIIRKEELKKKQEKLEKKKKTKKRKKKAKKK